MVKSVSRSTGTNLYEDDFYLWVERQADLLRKSRFRDLDLAHLIEEVDDLGANLRNAVTSLTREIILHLLKLQYSPAAEPRAGWQESVGKQRDDLELELTPSLRRHLTGDLYSIYQRARRRAIHEPARDRVTPDQLPATCQYTMDQLLDPNWYPNNVHGIKDPTP